MYVMRVHSTGENASSDLMRILRGLQSPSDIDTVPPPLSLDIILSPQSLTFILPPSSTSRSTSEPRWVCLDVSHLPSCLPFRRVRGKKRGTYSRMKQLYRSFQYLHWVS